MNLGKQVSTQSEVSSVCDAYLRSSWLQTVEEVVEVVELNVFLLRVEVDANAAHSVLPP